MNEYKISSAADNSRAAADAMKFCRENGITRLVLETAEYHFYPETADEDICCVSNHGHNGFKRAAFVIKDMDGFELDCGGSLLVFHGAMTPFIIHGSKNVVLKNFRVRFMRTLHGQFDVAKTGENYVDITPHGEQGFAYENGLLYLENEQGDRNLVYSAVEFDGENGPVENAGEQCFGKDFLYIKNEEISKNVVRIYNPPRKPSKNVILIAAERYGSGVLVLDSENVTLENGTIHSCYGVAFHCQLSKNIKIINCRTKPFDNTCFASNADATHFVSCRGTVEIIGCVFENQLDDGVNVHGVYTKIIGKTENSITVKFVHYQCRGLKTHEPGCRVSILKSGPLIPYKTLRVKSVQTLNTETDVLYFDGDLSDVKTGDIADSIDFYPEVLIENCEFKNNRARGILIGSNKKAVIRNNRFHTAGTTLKLECDCAYWYESGCVRDLTFENNILENCLYADTDTWGTAVIHFQKRESEEPEKYYHGRIAFKNNDFSSCKKHLFDIGNAEEIVFENNKIPQGSEVNIRHCKKIVSDLTN